MFVFRRPNVQVLAIARGTRRRFAAQLLLPLRYVGPSKLRISGTVFILFYFRKRLKGKFAVPALKAIKIVLIMRSSVPAVAVCTLFYFFRREIKSSNNVQNVFIFFRRVRVIINKGAP